MNTEASIELTEQESRRHHVEGFGLQRDRSGCQRAARKIHRSDRGASTANHRSFRATHHHHACDERYCRRCTCNRADQ